MVILKFTLLLGGIPWLLFTAIAVLTGHSGEKLKEFAIQWALICYGMAFAIVTIIAIAAP